MIPHTESDSVFEVKKIQLIKLVLYHKYPYLTWRKGESAPRADTKMEDNKKNEYEWNRRLIKRKLLMRGFIGTMEHLTEQVSNLHISIEDYIVRSKIVFEEYEKSEVEE